MITITNIMLGQAFAQAPTLSDEVPEVTANDFLTPNILLIVAILGLFILMVYLPQKRRNKEHGEMLNELRKGDKIVTTGGLVGKVVKTDDLEIIIESGDGSKITILRAAITGKYDNIVGSKPPMANENNKTDKKADKKEDKAS